MEDFPQPRMVVLAGPNGSGKSTVTKGLEQDERFPKLYLNADVIAKELEKPVAPDRLEAYTKAISETLRQPPEAVAEQLRTGIENSQQRNLFAATLAETGRQKAVGGTEPFAFETVMSTPAKMGLFDEARRNGFQVDMVFVTTESSDINVARVGNRVLQGGHDVPEASIRQRYDRAMELLPAALQKADTAAVYDNSVQGVQPTLVAQKIDGKLVFPELTKPDKMSTEDFERMQTWVEERIKGPLLANERSREALTDSVKGMPGATVAPADVTNGTSYSGRIVGVTDRHVMQHIDGTTQFVLHDRNSPLTPPSLRGVNEATDLSVTTAYNFGPDGKFAQPQQVQAQAQVQTQGPLDPGQLDGHKFVSKL